MSPWDYPEVSNDTPTLTEPIDDNDPYYRGELAFDWSEDKAIILDNLSQYASSYCDWSRVGYHVCSHDNDEPSPCEWEDQRESGSVPPHVPSFE